MKMLMTVAALLLFMLPVQAQHHPAHAPRPGHNVRLPKHVHHHDPIAHTSRTPIRDYHRHHGEQFKPGLWRYRGPNHHHWTYSYWDKHYGTNLYWDPGVRNYFYWCKPHNCYYPITYVPLGTYYFEEQTEEPPPVQDYRPEPYRPITPVAPPVAVPGPPTTCPCGGGCKCPPGCCCHRR
jgi:hypothetical protein